MLIQLLKNFSEIKYLYLLENDMDEELAQVIL